MKITKQIISSIFFLFIINISTAQESFQPGWYIINSGAKYSTIYYSGSDVSNYADEEGNVNIYTISTDDFAMNAGEVVIAYEFNKGNYFCFDPWGRMLVFSGENSLSKAPILPGSGVGQMNETIELIDGSEISSGAYYWIVGQNIANSTITIQVNAGKKQEIPQSKISLLSAQLRKLTDALTYKYAQ